MNAIKALSLALLAVFFITPLLAGSDSLLVESVWARTTAPQAKMGAIYLRITNAGSDDRLISAKVDASIASALSIHEMKQDERGMMRMLELTAGLPVTAGATVDLAPGGKHLMLEGLKGPLQIGQAFEITLNFERTGEKRVSVEVKARGSESPAKTP